MDINTMLAMVTCWVRAESFCSASATCAIARPLSAASLSLSSASFDRSAAAAAAASASRAARSSRSRAWYGRHARSINARIVTPPYCTTGVRNGSLGCGAHPCRY